MTFRSQLFGTILRAPDTGGDPLSVEQAVAAIQAPAAEEPPEQPEAVEPEPEAEVEPGEPEAEVESEPEAEPEPEPEADPPLDPPHYWSAQDKEAFVALPRHLQETVRAYERNRDVASAKVIQEAAEARKAAEQQREAIAREIETLAAARAKLEDTAPEIATIKAKWPEVIDWAATLNNLTAQHGADDGLKQYLLLKEQHAADQQQIAAVEAAKRDADEKLTKAAKEKEAADHAEFVKVESIKLAQVAPDLADPKQGPERLQSLAKFLRDNGVTDEQIRTAGAFELSMAYDAMRYRQAKAGAAQVQARPKPPPQPAGRTLRPSSPPTAVPTETRRVQEAEARFRKSGSPEDAAALIMARQGR